MSISPSIMKNCNKTKAMLAPDFMPRFSPINVRDEMIDYTNTRMPSWSKHLQMKTPFVIYTKNFLPASKFKNCSTLDYADPNIDSLRDVVLCLKQINLYIYINQYNSFGILYLYVHRPPD